MISVKHRLSPGMRGALFYTAFWGTIGITPDQSIMVTLGWGIAPLIGSPLSGILFDGLGPSKLFIIAAAVVVAAIVLILPTFYIWQKEQAAARIFLAGEEHVPGSNT